MQPIAKDEFSEADEKAFLEFVRSQPSCLSGDPAGVVAAHVRRVSYGAGIGRKPYLFSVALTDDEHKYQHQHGELATLLKFCKHPFTPTVQGAKAFFTNCALQNRRLFLRERAQAA